MDGAHIRMFTVSQPLPDEYDEFGDPIIQQDEQANVVDPSATAAPAPSSGAIAASTQQAEPSVLSTEVLAGTATAFANVHGIHHAAVPSGGGPIV
jgi:hypothetical protein